MKSIVMSDHELKKKVLLSGYFTTSNNYQKNTSLKLNFRHILERIR